MAEDKAKGDKVAKTKLVDAKAAKAKLAETREKAGGFRKEFMEFINRGSVVDLAVGVAVGGAFTAIVNSLVNDIVMPVVGLILGGVDLTALSFTVPRWIGEGEAAEIRYGAFLQNVLQFLIIAWVIFLLIKAMNRVHRMRDKKEAKGDN